MARKKKPLQFDTSWYVEQEGRIQEATLRAKLARLGVARVVHDKGYLYVAEFDSGLVKVGQAVRPRGRLAQHAAQARVHGGKISRSWVSDRHAGYDDTERTLIAGCKLVGELTHGREYFRDVDFDWATQYAAMVVLDHKRRAHLNSLVEAAGGDLSVSWQEAEDRLAVTEGRGPARLP